MTADKEWDFFGQIFVYFAKKINKFNVVFKIYGKLKYP
jgi:hypothetical protein